METKITKRLRVTVTGPESTGKTVTSEFLVKTFGGMLIPEYAREYISKLSRPYEYKDVETIARYQIQQYKETSHQNKLIVFDTWLIITKVWFEWVFQKVPEWLEKELIDCPMDLFILMKPDIPWIADPVRENGGENRLILYKKYKLELQEHNFPFVEIEGSGSERFKNAKEAINQLIVNS